MTATEGRVLLLSVLTALALDAQEPTAVDFTRDVLPILRDHCIRCHGPARARGRLRLDRREDVLGRTGEDRVLVPGRPEESRLLGRLVLPDGDRKRMPRGAPPLDAAAIATLRRWIEGGASWPPSEPEPRGSPVPELAPLDAAGRSARDRVLAGLRARGAIAAPMEAGGVAVRVDLARLRADPGAEDLASLSALAPQLVSLSLRRTAFDDALARALEPLVQLRRLDLGATAITDAALPSVAKLPRLRWLDLHGTRVTDAGMRHLAGLTRLRRLYLWRTGVTAAGAEALAAALPDCRIDRGGHAEAIERVRRSQETVNDRCPLQDRPVDPAFTAEDGGRRIGFCCEKCLATFLRDPAAHRSKVIPRR